MSRAADDGVRVITDTTDDLRGDAGIQHAEASRTGGGGRRTTEGWASSGRASNRGDVFTPLVRLRLCVGEEAELDLGVQEMAKLAATQAIAAFEPTPHE